MSRTYSTIGINLKGMPFAESDRLLTLLTPEYGLIRVVAPGARKPKSKLAGRSGLFVVNQLLIAKGRSLDKITQAETLKSYGGLSQNLGKLASSQYLAELVLYQALSEHPQQELFLLLSEHLTRLENLPNTTNSQTLIQIIAYLVHGTFHLLASAGIAPQVQVCSVTQRPIMPDFRTLNWWVGFSFDLGGTVSLSGLKDNSTEQCINYPLTRSVSRSNETDSSTASPPKGFRLNAKLNAAQLSIWQRLALPQLTEISEKGSILGANSTILTSESISLSDWISVEQLLRRYAEYHLGRTIRSASLVDTYIQSQLNALF